MRGCFKSIFFVMLNGAFALSPKRTRSANAFPKGSAMFALSPKGTRYANAFPQGSISSTYGVFVILSASARYANASRSLPSKEVKGSALLAPSGRLRQRRSKLQNDKLYLRWTFKASSETCFCNE